MFGRKESVLGRFLLRLESAWEQSCIHCEGPKAPPVRIQIPQAEQIFDGETGEAQVPAEGSFRAGRTRQEEGIHCVGVGMASVRAKGLHGLIEKAAEMTINWYPGHMASANRVIRYHLKNVDLVIEVRDARIPLASANKELQDILIRKKRLIVLNKMDLANPNMILKWGKYFEACGSRNVFVNANSAKSVQKMLDTARDWLQEEMAKEPTLLLMLVGIPNVGKSALLNRIYQLTRAEFSAQERLKKAKVGPLPGVTRSISGFQVGKHPSIYALDTPGVLVPNIGDVETGLKLSLTGAVKDSVVGEQRIVKYLLSVLNARDVYLHWTLDANFRQALNGKRTSAKLEDVRHALASTFQAFDGNIEDTKDMVGLVEAQVKALLAVYKVPETLGDVGFTRIAQQLLQMFRAGNLGRFTLDKVPIY